MEGVGRMLPSQTGAATRPTTVAPMTRPQPQRLEAVVQPQQQALRHKQVKHRLCASGRFRFTYWLLHAVENVTPVWFYCCLPDTWKYQWILQHLHTDFSTCFVLVTVSYITEYFQEALCEV